MKYSMNIRLELNAPDYPYEDAKQLLDQLIYELMGVIDEYDTEPPRDFKTEVEHEFGTSTLKAHAWRTEE